MWLKWNRSSVLTRKELKKKNNNIILLYIAKLWIQIMQKHINHLNCFIYKIEPKFYHPSVLQPKHKKRRLLTSHKRCNHLAFPWRQLFKKKLGARLLWSERTATSIKIVGHCQMHMIWSNEKILRTEEFITSGRGCRSKKFLLLYRMKQEVCAKKKIINKNHNILFSGNKNHNIKCQNMDPDIEGKNIMNCIIYKIEQKWYSPLVNIITNKITT